MTNTEPRIFDSPHDEETFIVQQVLSLRHSLELTESDLRDLTSQKRRTEVRLAEAEKALTDFMTANGLKQTEVGDLRVTLGTSQSVDILDVASVPDRYLRTKTVTEVNKALIKAEHPPESNWLKYKTSPKLTITIIRA